MVSEIGLGAEWLERHNYEECKAIIDCAERLGINILDCWMSEPNVRANIGKALAGRRESWFIQGISVPRGRTASMSAAVTWISAGKRLRICWQGLRPITLIWG